MVLRGTLRARSSIAIWISRLIWLRSMGVISARQKTTTITFRLRWVLPGVLAKTQLCAQVQVSTGIRNCFGAAWRSVRYIGPVGNGRVQVPHTSFTNIFPGILNVGAGGTPVPIGAPLPANTVTNMTIRQFMQIYSAQIGAVQQALAPSNDLSIRQIQKVKSGANLYPHEYPVQRSYHMNVGVQHDLGHDMVLNVDFVRRVFVNTLLGALDYNRFNRRINGVQSPVIPICTSTAQRNDPNAQCSDGCYHVLDPCRSRRIQRAARQVRQTLFKALPADCILCSD